MYSYLEPLGHNHHFGPFWGCFLQFLKKKSRNLPILCARFEELPNLGGVCFMTFIHISNRWAIITILGDFGFFCNLWEKKSRNLGISCARFEELPKLGRVRVMTFIHISNRWAIITMRSSAPPHSILAPVLSTAFHEFGNTVAKLKISKPWIFVNGEKLAFRRLSFSRGVTFLKWRKSLQVDRCPNGSR